MREIVFALEFRGRAGPVAGSPTKRRAISAAPSQTLTTVLGADGVRTRVEEIAGERAVLESRVERFEDGTFVEDGTITYGRAGSVSFVTAGRGTVAPSRSEEHTSELQSRQYLVCRLLLEKKKNNAGKTRGYEAI